MELQNSFEVMAPADVVFAFLLDVNRVAGCIPGAELTEAVDPTTFKGRVKIRVGPVTVAYNGTARIVEQNATERFAVVEGEGRETTGAGRATARARMSVAAIEGGARVVFDTELTVAGRVAQFGRGLIEDVSRSIVKQMAERIKSQLEGATPVPEALDAEGPIPATSLASGPGLPLPAPTPMAAKPVSALGLMFEILRSRLRQLLRRG